MRNAKIQTSFMNWLTTRPKTIGFLVFLILSIAIIAVSLLRSQIVREEEHQEMNRILSNVDDKIEQSLKNCYTTTVSLALTLDDEGIPQNFDTISKELLHSNPLVSAVQLVPDGIIKHIYPLKGNEAALNLNILGYVASKIEAKKSIENQKIYFAGPLKLKQGGIGIVGRLPIYHKNKFWGFSAVIIKYETLLKISGINDVDKTKYYFQFSKKNPVSSKEEFFLPSITDLSNKYFVSQTINDSDWVIYLVAKKNYTIYYSIIFSALSGFIIAILLGVLTTKILKTPEELRVLLKKQEIKLLKNEMKFKTFIDQAPIGFSIIDTSSGNILEVNKKYCSIFGYTAEEIKKMGIISLTHPDDLESSLNYIEKLHKGEITEYSIEKRCSTKNGKNIWVYLTVSQLVENNGNPTTHIAFLKDITKRKESEELIKKNQEKYKSLIDTIDGIVWEYDLVTMSNSFISKKIEDLLGYSVEDYLESPTFWEDHIHPEDREYALALSAKVNKNYSHHDYEYRMITKKGEVIWIRDIINFVFEMGKPVTSRGIMIDVTKMKEAEKNLNDSLQLVIEQNKRLLNFSYIVSHNLRSHTSNIESIISLIEAAESEEERNEMMHLLKSVSDSLDETMKHLNEVVNINTNINMVTKPLKLNKYINKAKEVLSEQILINEATFITDVPEDAMINYNSAYLESILYNLISNAIRYSHPQRKPIINIKFYKENNKDVIEVSDNGIGIDLIKNADKIFGMYKTFSTNSDARGIGLFITKNQVDAMGGTMTVESTPNQGTTFKIYTR